MKHYDQIFITNLPSFYKIRLYNEISKYKNIIVIYTGHAADGRNADFYDEIPVFDSYQLKGSVLQQTWAIIGLLMKLRTKELCVSGWDHPVMWMGIFISRRSKNSIVVESSYHESKTNGVKGLLKRIFMTRVSKAYVSGKSHKQLLDRLGYHGICIITGGVGIFNYQPQALFVKRDEVKRFLYVGRFIEEKNLKLLIRTFNSLPMLELHLVGFGIQEKELRTMAGPNVLFHGAVNNKKLPELYRQMDVFILPSKSEPWGLVVEEALNNGLPVLVSNHVGCAEEIVNESNGIVFQYNSSEDLKRCIRRMQSIDFYNTLREHISHLDFGEIERRQVQCYLN